MRHFAVLQTDDMLDQSEVERSQKLAYDEHRSQRCLDPVRARPSSSRFRGERFVALHETACALTSMATQGQDRTGLPRSDVSRSWS
jgi:hypothetical protein